MDIVRRREARRRHRARSAARRRSSSRKRSHEAGRAHHGHPARGHRPGRGPRTLRRACSTSSASPSPPRGTASTVRGGASAGRPTSAIRLLVRPSATCWAAAAWRIVYDDDARCEKYMAEAAKIRPTTRCYLDRFLEDAIEVRRRRALRRRGRCYVARRPGAHRGWRASTRATRPAARRRSRSRDAIVAQLREIARQLALRLRRRRPAQRPVRRQGRQVIYVIEANPRASRTVPFVVQGHRRAAWPSAPRASWRGRRFADLGLPRRGRATCGYYAVQGGRHAFRPLPGRRRGAGARDEV